MTMHPNRIHQKGGFLGLSWLDPKLWTNFWENTKNAASGITSGLSNSFPSSSSTTSYTPAPAPVAPAPTSSINSWGGRRHRKRTMKEGRRKLRNTRRRH